MEKWMNEWMNELIYSMDGSVLSGYIGHFGYHLNYG